MKLTLAVFWPTKESIGGIRSGEPIQVSDAQRDLADLGLSLKIDMPSRLCPEKELVLTFSHLRDFRPEGVIKNTPYLANIFRASEFITQAEQQRASPQEVLGQLKSWPGLPVGMETLTVEDAEAKPPAGSASALDNILEMVAVPSETPRLKGLEAVRSALDRHVGRVVSHVLQDDGFRHLEALWRSIHLAFRQSSQDTTLRFTIFPFQAEDPEGALGSALPNLLEALPSLLIVDLPLDSSPRHLQLFRSIAELGQTLLVPALCWIGPEFLRLGSWEELDRLPYLVHHLEEPGYAKWRQLQKDDSAQWLAVTCNRCVLRRPHAVSSSDARSPGDAEPLWGSPVWALAGLMVQSKAKFGWPTHFSAWKEVILEGLDIPSGDQARAMTTEAILTDDRLRQFSAIRIMPLMGYPGRDVAMSPLDVTLAGGPLCDQLFVAMISQELIACREEYQGPVEPNAVRAYLEDHFAGFFAKHGRVGPERLEVTADMTPAGCRSRLFILPSRTMLPTRREFSMDLDWS